MNKERDRFPDGESKNIWGWEKEFVNRNELPLKKKRGCFYYGFFFFLSDQQTSKCVYMRDWNIFRHKVVSMFWHCVIRTP